MCVCADRFYKRRDSTITLDVLDRKEEGEVNEFSVVYNHHSETSDDECPLSPDWMKRDNA